VESTPDPPLKGDGERLGRGAGAEKTEVSVWLCQAAQHSRQEMWNGGRKGKDLFIELHATRGFYIEWGSAVKVGSPVLYCSLPRSCLQRRTRSEDAGWAALPNPTCGGHHLRRKPWKPQGKVTIPNRKGITALLQERKKLLRAQPVGDEGRLYGMSGGKRPENEEI